MGGNSAPKQKESQAEKAQAQRALARLKEWESDGFKHLESTRINDAHADHTESYARRGNADLEAAIAEQRGDMAYTVGQGTFAPTLDIALRDTTTLKRANALDAMTKAQETRDQNMLKMAKVGQDVSASLDSAYANAANRGAAKENTRVNTSLMRSRARTQAIVDAVSGAAMGYMGRGAKPAAGAKYSPENTNLTGDLYRDPSLNQAVT